MITFFGLILWLLIASAVVLYLAGTLGIDWAQKKAWRQFADKYKLEITGGLKFADPVAVSGVLNGREISIYALSEQNNDERMRRRYAHIEVYLNGGPATRFVISKKQLPARPAALVFDHEFVKTGTAWPRPAVAKADDTAVLDAWLVAPRLRALADLMKFCGQHDEVMLMGDGKMAFILWRTADPVKDPRVLNALVQKLYGFVKDLEDQSSTATTKPKAPSVSTPAATEA